MIITDQDNKLAATTVAVAVRPEGSIPVGQVSDRCDTAPHCVGKRGRMEGITERGKSGGENEGKEVPQNTHFSV